MILYAIMAYAFDFFFSYRGSFAVYYLNPRSRTLDAKLYPSIQYLLGLRQHRYRYYSQNPEYAPIFDF